MRTILLVVTLGLIAGCQSAQLLGEMADSVSDGRWCTSLAAKEMIPAPSRYAMTRARRTECGRPASSIRFSTAMPMTASVC